MGVNICEDPNDFELEKYQLGGGGQNIKLSDYNGKAILLSFMCIRCGWCWAWVEHMQQIQNDYETNPNVQVLGVIYNYADASDSSGHEGPVDVAWIEEKLTAYGLTITFPLLMDISWNDANSVAKQYLLGFSGMVGFPWSYIISKNFKITSKWHRLSTSNGELLSFDSGDLNDTEYFTRHRLEDLQIDRVPWDTVFVLDYSGSMGSSVTIEGITQPKIDFLKEAISTLLKVWKDYALCEDQIGLVYFSSNSTTDGALISILPDQNIEDLIENIISQSPEGCTAMGAGVASGRDILEPSAHRRFIVLFTDGMQNRNPLVYIAEIPSGPTICYERHINNIGPEDYPDPLTRLCGDNLGQSNYAGNLPVVLDGLNINIHSIGIGVPSTFSYILNSISVATHGRFSTAIDIWPNLKEFFLETLVELYRGSSLQVITKKQATLDSEMHEISFLLNKSVKKITVLLSWVDESAPLTFKLKKDNQTIDLNNKLVEDLTYRFSTLSFPHYQKKKMITRYYRSVFPHYKSLLSNNQYQIEISNEIINPEGTWKVIIERLLPNRQIAIPYHLMILADDKILKYKFEFPKEIYTGDLIPLAIKVLEFDKPLDKIFSAEVVIYSPISSIGDITSKYKITEKLSMTKDLTEDFSVIPLAQKLELMLQDKDILKTLRNSRQDILKLESSWKTNLEKRAKDRGLFQGKFEKTQIPGIYKLDFKIRGVGKKCGIFERTESRFLIVKAKPDKELTKIVAVYKEKEGQLLINITPTDKLGNLIGPGFNSSLHCKIEEKPTGEVIDNLDGSYQIKLKISKREELTKKIIEIELMEIIIFKDFPEKLI